MISHRCDIRTTERIRRARELADELGVDLDIQVDGGVGQDNVHVVFI